MAKLTMKPRRAATARTAATPEAHPRVTRAAAAPAPAPARKTQFRSDRPTPVRPVQQAADSSRRVLKRAGRTGTRRGSQREQVQDESEEEDETEEDETEEEEDGETVTLRGRPFLSLVPEANDDDDDHEETTAKQLESRRELESVPESSPPNVSRYEPLPNLLPNDDSVSVTSVSQFFSTPEPDLSNTQIDIEQLDVELMLEMFPHLDAHGRKILDLLILKPPPRDLRRLLLVPGSTASKRLRAYEQNFAASKMAYGTSEYISVRQVETALGGDESFRPLLHISNLSILANVAYTSQGSGDSTFGKLKQIERDFPVQFGDVVRGANFQAALDLRTQYLVLALVNQQDMGGFDPDMWLKLVFFEGNGQELKPWPGVEGVHNWRTRVIQRVEEIRGTFAKNPREPVDIPTLVDQFPWDDFVKRISSYVKTRFSEIERLRSYKSVEGLVEKVRKPEMLEDARVIDLLDDREIPETVQEGPTPVKPHVRLPQQLPEVDPGTVAAPVAVFESATAKKDEGLLTVSSELSRLKHMIEQQGREALGSTSVYLTTAQMKDLKRRKTMPTPETIPVVRGTPRVATSLGSKDEARITMAEMRFLKCLKARAEAPNQTGPSKEPEAPKKSVAPTQAAEDPAPVKAPAQAEDPASTEAPGQAEVSGPMEDDGVEEDNAPESITRADLWKVKLNLSGIIKNKENDESLAATIPPPQPGHPLKRKRFVDPQEGASRVSQIDDGARELPAKRQQLQKGKEKEVIIEEVEESRPAFETEGQDEAEDAEMYEVDSRKEDEERLKKSREGLPDIGPSNAARASTSSATASAAPGASTSSAKTGEQNGSKPRRIAPTRASRSSKGSRALGGTDASRKLSAPGVSDVNESDIDDAEYEEEEDGEEEDREGEGEGDETDDDNESADNDARRAELNRRVQKMVEKNPVKKGKPQQLLRTRQPWGREETALLIRVIGEFGCKWAEIRDMDYPEFSGRSNIQLKDKARNIKYDYLRAKQKLPPNFEGVTISATQVRTLHQMGINYNDYI